MMHGPILLTIAKVDGTFRHYQFEEECELMFVIYNSMCWGEKQHTQDRVKGNVFLARRRAKDILRARMQKEGR